MRAARPRPLDPPGPCDVLVVGAGLAGSAAALEATAAGASVILVDAGAGSSPRAQGGIAAALGPDDAPRLHERDTLAAGAAACAPAAVRSLTAEAAAAVAWLAGHGVAFDVAPGGELALAQEAAHSRPRVVHAGGDATGEGVMAALERELEAVPPGRLVRIHGARLAWLLLHDELVAGAGFALPDRRLQVRAGAVVLATGGYAGLFERTTNSRVSDGQGILAALAAGASAADLEFVQFHPTAFAGAGPGFLVTEALRGAGAHLTDGAGRRFCFDADERGELAPRSIVARAIAEQLRRSGEPHVLLDARRLSAGRLRHEFPGFLARCRRYGIDPLAEAVPVAPAAHYTMGGVVTDLGGRTEVPGLWAAGECARTGVHGANRLASNSLLEAVVFGRRAGRGAVGQARSEAEPSARRRPRRAAPGSSDTGDARRLLSERVGLVRDAAGLAAAAARLDAGGMAGLVARSALAREESRGSHVRSDFPETSPDWAALEVAVAGSRGSRLQVRQRPMAA